MYLALRELKYSKSKFILIVTVVILISYLVYFLTSLATGLANSYTSSVKKWEADSVLLTKDSNDNMMMSYIMDNDFNDIKVKGDKAKIGLFPAVISNPLEDKVDSRMDVYVFGIENDSFLKPEEHKLLNIKEYDVIVDEELEKEGYKVGDKFLITGSKREYTIIGFSSNSKYQTLPVIYMDLKTLQEYRYGTSINDNIFNGIVIKGEIEHLNNKFKDYTIKDYFSTLPGYNAQVLTFSIMIVFLIIITAFVLGIFIYVLTIQKTSMFGVMKAQGISNWYIGGSVVIQTFILVGFGLLMGLVLTLLCGLFLSDIIPFSIDVLFYLLITLSFFLFSFFGGLFSVRAVLKIDPLKAIGG